MKKFLVTLMVASAFCLYADARGEGATYQRVRDFTKWDFRGWGTGTVQLEPINPRVRITADGTEGDAFGGLYRNIKNVIGMKANLRVSHVLVQENDTYVTMGIRNSVGLMDEKRIEALIYLCQHNQNKSIRWEIIEHDDVAGTQKTLALGIFGSWENGWNVKENITVKFQRSEKGILFWVKDAPETVWWKPKAKLTPINWSPEIFAYTGYGHNSLRGAVTGVYLIYK